MEKKLKRKGGRRKTRKEKGRWVEEEVRVFGFNSALITKFPPREERTSSHDDFTLPRSLAPNFEDKISVVDFPKGNKR